MSVFRINKNNDYTTMSNYHLKDKRLTLKAKGLLSVMLSLSDEWNYSVAGLCSISKENETAINSALKELKDCGYLIVSKERGTDGKFEYNYDIFERPTIEKPGMEKPGMENMGVANNINNINNNEVNTKDKILNNKKEEKEKINNNTKEIFDYWNEKKIHAHRDISDFKTKIDNVLKEHSVEEIKLAIDHYKEVLDNPDYFYKYKWTLNEFLGREKGYKEFLDNGNKWENYKLFKEKQKSYNPYKREEISRETKYPELDDIGYYR